MNKAIFLDRDGVINEIVYETDGKIMAPANLEQLKIMDKAKEGIAMMKELGFKVIGITNQPGVAFGYLNQDKLKEINNHLKSELGIDEIYFCPHHPRYDPPCTCKKPQTGMIEQAKKDFDLDVKNSFMVGDSLSDIQTGKNANVKKTFRVGVKREDILELQHQKNIYPDFTLPNLLEVAEKIKEIES
jgi:histidinol-phosphate phosphatase family protein